MTISEFLDKTFLGNPLATWGVAFAVAFATLLLLMLLRRLVLKRFATLAEATKTNLDDVLISVLETTRLVFLLLVSLWAGSRSVSRIVVAGCR